MRLTPSLLALALALLTIPATAEARKPKPKPKERYYVQIGGVESTLELPAGLDKQAIGILSGLVSARPEFVTSLEGAPDPATAPEAFTKYLLRKRLRAFSVVIKVTALEIEALPAEPGEPGKVLKVHVGLSLLGSGLPDRAMALAGDGASTVKLEIGAKVRPRDQEAAFGDALTGALTSAVDDAVRKLAAGPRAKPAKR